MWWLAPRAMWYVWMRSVASWSCPWLPSKGASYHVHIWGSEGEPIASLWVQRAFTMSPNFMCHASSSSPTLETSLSLSLPLSLSKWSHSWSLQTYMTYIRAIREVWRIFTLFAYIFYAWNPSVFMSVLFFSNFVTHGFGAKTLKFLWVVRANVIVQLKYNRPWPMRDTK